MAAAKKPRLKAPAADALQSRDEAAARIRQIGDLQREMQRSQTIMNDKIAEITEVHQPGISANEQQIKALFAQVQAWCETNRADLTDDYKIKSANLITGEIGWRADPPSIAARDLEALLPQLDSLGLETYIRLKRDLNKEAILNDRALLAGKEEGDEKTAAMERLAKLAGVSGITIRAGVEKFFITPFEQVIEAA
jgi:phage host-nuclease inhibitor protein Gam